MSATLLADLPESYDIGPGTAVSDAPLQSWAPVAESSVLIVIGVTGVGKSTAMAALRDTGASFSLLPNRRELTDRAILPRYCDGPVKDRLRRFEFTRRFAREQRGGMAHILGQLHVDPAVLPGPLVFDGLRGADEVAHAAATMPKARFLVLTAPDFVRLMRLALRADAFDRCAAPPNGASAALPELDLLTPAERFQLDGWIRFGALDPVDLRAKLDIITAERRNYDAAQAIQVLMELAPERSLVIDTSAVSPPMIGMAAARLLAP